MNVLNYLFAFLSIYNNQSSSSYICIYSMLYVWIMSVISNFFFTGQIFFNDDIDLKDDGS